MTASVGPVLVHDEQDPGPTNGENGHQDSPAVVENACGGLREALLPLDSTQGICEEMS
jgi:hypothetical protein